MDELKPEEILKLKTLSEFLFYDLYQYWVSYPRFELFFNPLFNNIDIDLFKVFTEISGHQKKYITYTRLIKAYLKNKKETEDNKNNINSDLNKFFNNIFNNILKGVDMPIGNHQDYNKNSTNIIHSFSTKNINKLIDDLKKSYITSLKILNDSKGNIKGIIIEYNGIRKYDLFPKELKNELNIGLELNLDIINKKSLEKHKKIYKDIDKSLYRDSITYIFGTINKTNNIISSLGFKCISGEVKYIGIPDGDSFLLGEFGKKFNNLKIEMNENGITLFEPKFVENKRKNYYLNNDKEIENEEYILDEDYLKNLKEEETEEFIKTPFLDEDSFNFDELTNNTENNQSNDNINSENHQKEDNKINIIEKESKNKIEKKESPFSHKENTSNIIKHSVSLCEPSHKEKNFDKLNNNEEQSKINEEKKSKIFLTKNEFKELKEKLAKSIYNQFYNKYNYDSNIPFAILNEVIPDEISDREVNEKEEEMIEKIKFIKMNGKTIKISNKYDSDDEKSNENNKIKKEDIKEKLINSDANELWKDIGYDFFEIIGLDKEYNKIKNNFLKNKKTSEQNWIHLSKRLKRKYGINLFQTIGSVIFTIGAVNKNNIDEIDLKQKIKYYKILSNKDNENIINFLTKKENKNKNDNNKNEIHNEKNNEVNFLLKKIKTMENSIKEIKEEQKKEKQEINKEKDKAKEKIMNDLINEKNSYIKKMIHLEKEKILLNSNCKSFLFTYQRKRSAMEEIDDLNISLMLKNSEKIKEDKELHEKEKENEKEKTFKRIKLTKANTFHGQESLDDIDPKFSPNKTSLCPLEEDNKSWKYPKKVLSSDIYNWELIKWRKVEDIKVFLGGTQPDIDNIRQGEYIGDCYFLSALGALCNEENYLKNLIYVVKKEPDKKIYAVKLNINGKWKYVLVDNYLPYIPDNEGNDDFCFGSSFRKELWVSLFEKAWAKVNGCYARIGCGGYCSDAFDVLTSAYTEIIKIHNINEETKEKLWNKLKKEKNNNNVICSGTRRLGIFENVGLISQHAYAIMNIYEVDYEGKKLRLVKLRNPWGEKEFNGDWSDRSPKWTDELKKKVDFEGVKDDGIFYMSYDDFIEYYSLLEILKFKSDYNIIASHKIKKTEAHKCHILQFEIKENKKNIFINLYQKNPRIIRKDGSYFPEPVKSFIILAKINEDGTYKYIKSISDTKVHIALKANLKKGKYLIFCDVNYRFVYYEIYGYNITIYSQKSKEEFKLENITDNYNGIKRAEILNEVLYDYFLKNKENGNKIVKIEEYKDIIFYKSTKFNEDFPFMIFILENHSQKKGIYFSCKLKYDKRKNVCIYNDNDVSEFDNFVEKEIKDKYTIILIMGYEVSDKFFVQPKFYDTKPNCEHFIFGCDKSSEDDNFEFYISFTARKRGYIFGMKKKNDKKIENINFNVEGMNIIDPLYNNNINDVYFSMSKKGETKVFSLRLKPDCENFDYHINY